MTSHFSSTYTIEFADTDMAGIMHFSNYFRLMERTEHAFWRAANLSIHMKVDERTVSWPRVRATCEYKVPLKFEDVVCITMTIVEQKSKSIRLGFEFHKQPVGELVAAGEFTVVCASIDADSGKMKAIEIPEPLLKRLAELGKQS